jgi:flavin-dependent dehydrogenase
MLSETDLKLNNGSRVAVIGGGPAGSFFSYFLLDMAERVGLQLQVDIYEPRDFSQPGPAGCNMCAGVVSESLVQTLAAEGINLPTTVVQRGIDSYVLHMDAGSVRIESLRREKRIAATFRGVGPRGLQEFKWESLDNHLMALAVKKGAHHVRERVSEVEWVADPTGGEPKSKLLRVKSNGGHSQTYELLAVTAGVNTPLLKLFQGLDFGYQPPRTTKCVVREYYLGEEAVGRNVGTSFHAFLLNVPGLDYAAIVPKGDYSSLALLGKDIDSNLLEALTNDPALKRCFPPDYPIDQVACWCAPRINVKGSARPFGDRIVFIGDSGVSRLYKDGIGAAYRAAKAAATTAIFEGISAEDFKRHYSPTCRAMEADNTIGEVLFAIVGQIQKRRFARRAVLGMVSSEQRNGAPSNRSMSMVMWDMLTGSAAYREIFLRTLHPAFWSRFLWELGVSLLSPKGRIQTTQSAALTAHDQPNGHSPQPQEEHAMEPGALGRVYQDGEIIVRQGEIGDCMFVVQEGQVEVIVERDGRETSLVVRGPGEFFGEMAIFEREVRMATVRAVGQARILTVDKKNFVRRMHEDPSLAYRLVQSMSHRIRQLSAEMARPRGA